MEKRMLSVRELAQYIGLAEQTIRNKLSAGTFFLPPMKLGNKVLFDKHVVDNYLDRLGK